MIVIKKGKEICYLLQKAGTNSNEIAVKKELLIKQGYLVVTIIEGKENMEKGLREVVRNHFH
ncbi:hypothetical protein [Faecalicatena faecalis]|uniref:hypothetical protein n=1 Tax=Faecalicatena faecalis TaxID=2726362 RepID=UPI001C0C9A9A|nr:hypothetical protein [Faecalicatena faecalis]